MPESPQTPSLTPPIAETVDPVSHMPGARSDFAVVTELLPWLRPFTGRIVLALFLIFAAKLVNLYVPLALKQLVDRLNIAPGLRLLPLTLLLSYGSSRVAVTLFTELRQIVSARVMARASREITLRVFRHLHGLSLKFHLARRTGGGRP